MSNSYPPNSSAPDIVYGTCPQSLGDTGYQAPCLSRGNISWWTHGARFSQVAARSHHPGGATAGMGDGSVAFAADSIDADLWRALGTRAGDEVASLPD